MKRQALMVFASAALIGTCTAASAADPVQVNLLSGPFATGSYVLSNALEQISKAKSAPVRINSSETPGLVFNTKKLDTEPTLKKSTIFSYTSGINYLAVHGLKPFGKKYPSAKLIANYNLGTVWLATFDPKIRTPKDLIGKTIALGRPTQILWTIEPELIVRFGWGLEGKIKIEHLGTSEAAQALLDGIVDAAIVGGYADPVSGKFAPSPQTVTLIGSGKKLHYVSWGRDAIEKTIAQGVAIAGYTVPAKAVEGLGAPLDSFVDAVAWMAYPDFDDATAYALTKMIIANVARFREYHALGKLMSPQSLVYGWKPADIHPGALRAYREAGLIK